ncbi:putative Zn-dependent protease [Rhizorhapis suberifaciens]|uniref:Putative Zn-dependent protease n=2 Tax=Rhizorhapis suberifaciens TaxID=13656 RepID=A0A840HZ62_9SPHN|nr:putative Zn-dependent protease [Rhizorhapis suberifaciens]
MRYRICLATASAALVLSSCMEDAGTESAGSGGPPSAISASEKQEGAKAHPELLKEFGGAYGGKQASYVTEVGRNIAVQSGLSNARSDFTISLLNTPVNNAFAIPGGYVYVTRQLMALMNDEAELAGVLGHEVGHVAARHSQKRQSTATRNTILGAIGQILVGAVAGDSQLGELLQRGIGTGSQLLTLRFSRTQEYEADDLGIRYLGSAGYDPQALSSMLASLAAQTALEARTAGKDARSVPEWASTHPDPASRVSRASQKATASGATGKLRNRDAFLTALDGVTYGDDPKQGVIEGSQFLHPALKLAFTAPSGFGMQNSTDAVSVSGSGAQAQFSGGSYNGDLDSYVRSVFRALGGNNTNVEVGTIARTTVNGLPAAYATVRANTSSGQVDVTVFAYEFSRSSAFHFVGLTQAGQGPGVLSPMYRSVRRLSDTQAAAIKARRVQVVTVKAGDTPASLANRMAYNDYKVDRFLVLNALQANSSLRAGQKVKVVTY